MSRRTIANCGVIKLASTEGIGLPDTEKIDKEFCLGYQKSENDDEPADKCMNCHLHIHNSDNNN